MRELKSNLGSQPLTLLLLCTMLIHIDILTLASYLDRLPLAIVIARSFI
jgi:hypothetical protein